MFWGISLEVGKRYSQTVEKSFHISMAALNARNDGTGRVTIMVEVEKACYPICTLTADKIPQQALDYVFTEGEEVLFYTEGDLDVHLTGYLIDEPNAFKYSSDEDESASASSSISSANLETNKERRRNKSEKESVGELISELDGLNEDNKDMINIWLQRSERSKRRREKVEDDPAAPVTNLSGLLLDNGDSEESEDNEWRPGGKRKLKKKQKAERKDKKTKHNIENDVNEKEDGDKNNSPNKVNASKSKKPKRKSIDSNIEEKSGKCDQDTNQLNNKQNVNISDCEEELTSRREFPDGLMIEDLVKGEGKRAKKGKQVSVYYKGCLKKTMKELDSCLKGKPFTFRLGQDDVIKGWEIGVEGMQIGGKRRLTIPPSLGYGSKQTDSSIPANSTLVFVVELLKVH